MTMSWVAPPMFASCMPLRRTAIRIEREEDAEHRARAAEDVDAAEHDGRDDVDQLRTRRRVGLDGAEVAEVDDRRDPGHEAGEHEDRHARRASPGSPEKRAASRFEPIANR